MSNNNKHTQKGESKGRRGRRTSSPSPARRIFYNYCLLLINAAVPFPPWPFSFPFALSNSPLILGNIYQTLQKAQSNSQQTLWNQVIKVIIRGVAVWPQRSLVACNSMFLCQLIMQSIFYSKKKKQKNNYVIQRY